MNKGSFDCAHCNKKTDKIYEVLWQNALMMMKIYGCYGCVQEKIKRLQQFEKAATN